MSNEEPSDDPQYTWPETQPKATDKDIQKVIDTVLGSQGQAPVGTPIPPILTATQMIQTGDPVGEETLDTLQAMVRLK